MRQGFRYYTESPNPSFFSTFLIDGGLVILSKLPLIETEFGGFKYGILSDGLSQKGILYAKILLDNNS